MPDVSANQNMFHGNAHEVPSREFLNPGTKIHAYQALYRTRFPRPIDVDPGAFWISLDVEREHLPDRAFQLLGLVFLATYRVGVLLRYRVLYCARTTSSS